MFKDTDEALARLEAELLAEEEEDLTDEEYEEYEEEPEEDESAVPPEYVYEDTRPSAGPVIYQNYSNDYGKNLRNYANGYRAYTADVTDEDPDAYSEELFSEEEASGKSNTALILIACLLSLAVAAVTLIFALKSRGIL